MTRKMINKIKNVLMKSRPQHLEELDVRNEADFLLLAQEIMEVITPIIVEVSSGLVQDITDKYGETFYAYVVDHDNPENGDCAVCGATLELNEKEVDTARCKNCGYLDDDDIDEIIKAVLKNAVRDAAYHDYEETGKLPPEDSRVGL